MDFIFNVGGMYLVGGALFLGALLYIIRKRKLRLVSLESKAVEPTSSEIMDDGFYCIRLEHGSCISGYMPKDKGLPLGFFITCCYPKAIRFI